MNIKPLGDRILVEPLDRESVTQGGLYIPENAQDKSQEGIVVAVGVGHWNDYMGRNVPVRVLVDDRVLFAKHAGTEIKKDGKTFLILNERDILAIL